MVNISYQGKSYQLKNSTESVLECLNRHGEPIPSSCRSGICQTCLMRATHGQPPSESQKGLKTSLREQNYFLACVCKPNTDLEVSLPEDEISHRIPAQVVGKKMLSHDVLKLQLKPEESFDCHPGQFINLVRTSDNLVRSYSIANVSPDDDALELQIRILNNGQMTTWLCECVQPGDKVEIEGPHGDCFYTPGNPEQNLLLVATGTGLAPLWGIIHDALAHNHKGSIYLFHGSSSVEGLYLSDELKTLQKQYSNLYYMPCISGNDEASGYTQGRSNDVALKTIPDLKDWRVFVCGHPQMVADMKRKAFLRGASLKEIHADPFVYSVPTPTVADLDKEKIVNRP